MSPIGFILRTVFQLQSSGKSLATVIQGAETAGQTLSAKLANKADTPQNRQQMRHIIGIERWGQRRLKTMLGEPPVQDEYEGYQPAEQLDMAALREAFSSTRAETVRLARAIEQRGNATTAKANHNDMGDVGLKLWVRYLTSHATLEATRIK